MAENKSTNPCPTCALLSLHPKESYAKRTARVEELLRRHSAPLDVELADFRLVVDNAPEILRDLDEKIVLAREMLDNLVRSRSQAESYLADAKSLIHPLRSLPYEVVSKIFSHCVPTWTMDEGSTRSLDPRTAPWTLTRVCLRWRHIALSLPNLWTYIGLNFGELDGLTSRQLLYKFGVFLERSKGLPLSVYILSLREIDAHPLFPLLEVTIPRWKQLRIAIPHSSLQSFSCAIFSSLETLVHSLDAVDYRQFKEDVSIFNLTSAPVLHAFKANPYVSWQAVGRIHLPWSRFIRVVDFPSDDIDAYNYLEKMTSLEDLTVLLMNVVPLHAPISLPTLLQLTIREQRNASSKALQAVFSTLDIPSLSNLRLDFQSRIHHFPRLQPATQDRLTSLSISCAMTRDPGNVQNLLRFLSDTPRVENFHIVDKNMTVDFISGLKISPSSSPPLLPRLRILDISDCFCDDALAENSVIYDMLHSRYASVMSSTSSASPTITPTFAVTFLEIVRVPRWLYFEDDDRWKEICRNLKVECGITMKDNDSDD